MIDHGGAMIMIKLFMPPLSFMLQLAAAAPGLSMPLSFMLLQTRLVIKLVIIMKIIVKVMTSRRK